MLVEAGVIKGREATSYNSIKTDMVNAGARWSDVEVATDEGIITSRSPKDLEAFVAKIIEEVGEGRHDRRARNFLQTKAGGLGHPPLSFQHDGSRLKSSRRNKPSPFRPKNENDCLAKRPFRRQNSRQIQRLRE